MLNRCWVDSGDDCHNTVQSRVSESRSFARAESASARRAVAHVWASAGTATPIRVEELVISHSTDSRTMTPEDFICTVEGCTNPHLEVDYGYARRCEQHHQERLRNGSRRRLVQVVYFH
jgi:hypothetical protein